MNSGKESSVFYTTFLPSSSFDFDDIIRKIRDVNEGEVILQLIDPKRIVSERQIQVALYLALKAFRFKNNIARDVATEFLIRLSGEKQISKAIDIYGINENSEYWMLISFGKDVVNNEEVAREFLKEINIKEGQLMEISFPLMSLKELSHLYNCKEDREEIEKKVLEKMAAITLL